MSDIVIKAENLGKKYIIGHRAERSGLLSDVLMQNARTLEQDQRPGKRGSPSSRAVRWRKYGRPRM